MAKSLIEQIKAARQTRVPSHGKTFIVSRPTDLDMLDLRSRLVKQGEIITRFVTGWDGFTELDLVSSGGPDPVEFDAALFAEYIADHKEHWDVIVNAVVNSYQAHQEATEESLKNSMPGSTSPT